MRNKYQNIENSSFIVCISQPDKIPVAPTGPTTPDAVVTPLKHYDIVSFDMGFQLIIKDDVGNNIRFNLYSPFGDSFCTISYLRKQKLKKIKINEEGNSN